MKKFLACWAIAMWSLAAVNVAHAGAPGSGDSFVPVTLCHATGSESNPYVTITVDNAGALNGHSKHEEDIIPAPAEGCPVPVDTTSGTTGDPTTTTDTGTVTSTTGDVDGGTTGEVCTPRGDSLNGLPICPVDHDLTTGGIGTFERTGTTGGTVSVSTARGDLPFTGLPMWMPLLAGLGMVASGGMLVRSAVRARR